MEKTESVWPFLTANARTISAVSLLSAPGQRVLDTPLGRGLDTVRGLVDTVGRVSDTVEGVFYVLTS